MMNRRTFTRHFQLPHRDLVYLKFIMEAHEGLATLSSADKLKGIVRITYDEGFASDVESLLSALKAEIALQECCTPEQSR